MGTLQFFNAPNVVESASSLLALRDQIEGRAERKSRQQREATTRQLAGMVLGGDPQASQSAFAQLQQHDPGAALALRQQQQVIEQNRLANDQAVQLNPLMREAQFNQNRISEQAIEANDQAVQAKKYAEVRKQTEETARLFGIIENDPNQWPDVRKAAIERGILPPETPETFPTKESMKAFRDRLKIMARATVTPEAFKAATDVEAGIENMRKRGIVTGKVADDMIRRYYEAQVGEEEAGIEQQKAATGKINAEAKATGPVISKGAQAAIEKDILAGDILGEKLSAIDELMPEIDSLTGLSGSAIRSAGGVLNYLRVAPQGLREQYGKAMTLDRRVQDVMDEYRRLITGATAPEAELKRIMSKLNAAGNSEQFRIGLTEFKTALDRAQAARRAALRRGVDPGSKELGKAIDEEWANAGKEGEQKTAAVRRTKGSVEDVQAFGDRLLGEGLSEAEITARIKAEFGGSP